jgi:uncharacterized metal-binding protein YceD (DUF177 family)
MASPLLVNAFELLRRPGTEKTISLAPTVAELDIDDPRLPADAVVLVELRLESLTDGIVVDGHIDVPWATCKSCIKPSSPIPTPFRSRVTRST